MSKIENLIEDKFNKIERISNDVIKCHVILEKLSKSNS